MLDLYITNVGPNVLYHNNGGKTFTDVTRAAGVARDRSAPAAPSPTWIAMATSNLFVTNYVDARLDNNIFCGDTAAKVRVYCHPLNFAPLASVLYHNNGNGTFTDISQTAGIAQQRGNGLGVVFGDYDDDGWVDIFVANDTTPNFLYHNDGAGALRKSPSRRVSLLRATAGRVRAWAPISATWTATAAWI